MPSLEGILANDIIMLRIYKRVSSNAERFWCNTYEFRAAVGVSDVATYATLINDWVDFERRLHLVDAIFSRAVLSTWVEDGTPYNPYSFKVYELGDIAGLLVGSGEPLPLNYVLNVKKEVETGRNGKIQYRRCLSEGDVNSPSGSPTAANPSALETRIGAALTAAGLEPYMGQGESGIFQLSMKNATSTRQVTDLVFGGVGITKYNHKWFDRL